MVTQLEVLRSTYCTSSMSLKPLHILWALDITGFIQGSPGLKLDWLRDISSLSKKY